MVNRCEKWRLATWALWVIEFPVDVPGPDRESNADTAALVLSVSLGGLAMNLPFCLSVLLGRPLFLVLVDMLLNSIIIFFFIEKTKITDFAF